MYKSEALTLNLRGWRPSLAEEKRAVILTPVEFAEEGGVHVRDIF